MKRFSILPVQRILLFAFILVLVSVSCMKTGNVSFPVAYNVVNNSGSGIKVVFNGLLDYWSGYQRYPPVDDSIVYLDSGEEKMLFITTWGNGTENPENGTKIRGLETIRIYRNDSIQSVSDFLQTKYWSFKQLGKTRGEMNLVVKTSDFNF